MNKKIAGLFTSVIGLSILLAGCSLKGEQAVDEVDVPQDTTYVDELEKNALEPGAAEAPAEGETPAEGEAPAEGEEEKPEEGAKEGESATAKRQLFLMDANGMVVPMTFELPQTNEVAKETLEYLVKDGPVTDMLPNGFQAVLPAGTTINGIDAQKDGTLIVDFSKEFNEYEAASEKKILESITYTLTQFENVKNVAIRVEGQDLAKMPVDGTPIGKSYSRADGINLMDNGITTVNSQSVTLYFPAEAVDGTPYEVPVTERMNSNAENSYEEIVNALIDGPAMDSNLSNVFNTGSALASEPTLKDGVLNLEFNTEVLSNVDEAAITDQLMETLVMSLTELEEVEAVSVKVEGVEEVFNEHGEAYAEPVSREQYVPAEKL
ncbi:GerMN domain-containing protein [Terribacillus aidingensis]|uniref:GerMN domain-containing protein n=1 Tax=Terribacillus aidingensis TaxID=586416 RepID=UPI00344C2B1E